MASEYERSGLRFSAPAGWRISEERQPGQFSVTVQPESEEQTGFWSVTLLYDAPSPEVILRTVMDAFREEYDELDDYPVEGVLAGRPAIGRDVEFVCLELTNTAHIRCSSAGTTTVLLVEQATDHELDDLQAGFDHLTASLAYNADASGEF